MIYNYLFKYALFNSTYIDDIKPNVQSSVSSLKNFFMEYITEIKNILSHYLSINTTNMNIIFNHFSHVCDSLSQNKQASNFGIISMPAHAIGLYNNPTANKMYLLNTGLGSEFHKFDSVDRFGYNYGIIEFNTIGKPNIFNEIISATYKDYNELYYTIYIKMKNINPQTPTEITCNFSEYIQYLFPTQDSNNCTIYAFYMLLFMLCKEHQQSVSLDNSYYKMKGIITELRCLLLNKYIDIRYDIDKDIEKIRLTYASLKHIMSELNKNNILPSAEYNTKMEFFERSIIDKYNNYNFERSLRHVIVKEHIHKQSQPIKYIDLPSTISECKVKLQNIKTILDLHIGGRSMIKLNKILYDFSELYDAINRFMEPTNPYCLNFILFLCQYTEQYIRIIDLLDKDILFDFEQMGPILQKMSDIMLKSSMVTKNIAFYFEFPIDIYKTKHNPFILMINSVNIMLSKYMIDKLNIIIEKRPNMNQKITRLYEIFSLLPLMREFYDFTNKVKAYKYINTIDLYVQNKDINDRKGHFSTDTSTTIRISDEIIPDPSFIIDFDGDPIKKLLIDYFFDSIMSVKLSASKRTNITSSYMNIEFTDRNHDILLNMLRSCCCQNIYNIKNEDMNMKYNSQNIYSLSDINYLMFPTLTTQNDNIDTHIKFCQYNYNADYLNNITKNITSEELLNHIKYQTSKYGTLYFSYLYFCNYGINDEFIKIMQDSNYKTKTLELLINISSFIARDEKITDNTIDILNYFAHSVSIATRFEENNYWHIFYVVIMKIYDKINKYPNKIVPPDLENLLYQSNIYNIKSIIDINTGYNETCIDETYIDDGLFKNVQTNKYAHHFIYDKYDPTTGIIVHNSSKYVKNSGDESKLNTNILEINYRYNDNRINVMSYKCNDYINGNYHSMNQYEYKLINVLSDNSIIKHKNFNYTSINSIDTTNINLGSFSDVMFEGFKDLKFKYNSETYTVIPFDEIFFTINAGTVTEKVNNYINSVYCTVFSIMKHYITNNYVELIISKKDTDNHNLLVFTSDHKYKFSVIVNALETEITNMILFDENGESYSTDYHLKHLQKIYKYSLINSYNLYYVKNITIDNGSHYEYFILFFADNGLNKIKINDIGIVDATINETLFYYFFNCLANNNNVFYINYIFRFVLNYIKYNDLKIKSFHQIDDACNKEGNITLKHFLFELDKYLDKIGIKKEQNVDGFNNNLIHNNSLENDIYTFNIFKKIIINIVNENLKVRRTITYDAYVRPSITTDYTTTDRRIGRIDKSHYFSDSNMTTAIRTINMSAIMSANLADMKNILHTSQLFKIIDSNGFSTLDNIMKGNLNIDIIKFILNYVVFNAKIKNIDMSDMYLWDGSEVFTSDILFEFYFGYPIRKDQYIMINNVFSSISNNHKFHSAIMGSGKSAVITPMLLLKSLREFTDKNIMCVSTKELVSQSAMRFILPTVGNIYNFDDIIVESGNAITTREIHIPRLSIVSDNFIKALKLSYVMLDKRLNSRNFVMIYDEIDAICDPRSNQLNIPACEPIKDDLMELIIITIEYIENVFRQIKMEERDRLFYVKNEKNPLINKTIPNKTINRFLLKCFIGVHGFDKEFVDGIPNRGYSNTNKHKMKLSSFCFDIYNNMCIVLSMIKGTNYERLNKFEVSVNTFDNKKVFNAIPYSATDAPLLDSEFTSKIQSILLTILSYCSYNDGNMLYDIRDIDVYMYLYGYYKKAKNFDKFSREYKIENPYKNQFDGLFSDFRDTKPILNDIIKFNYTKKVLDHVRQKIDHKEYVKLVIYKFLTETFYIYNASSSDILLSGFTKYRTGFTGTPEMHIPIDYDPIDKISDRIDNTFVKTVDDAIINAPDSTTMSISSKNLDEIVEQMIRLSTGPLRYNTLIDVGAYFTGTTIDMIKIIYGKIKSSNKYDCIVYINDDGVPMIYNNDKVIKYNIDYTTPLERRFTFYSNRFITGIDLTLDKKSYGVVTFNPTTRYRDMAQGVFRLRKINKSQKCRVFVYNEYISTSISTRELLVKLKLNDKKYMDNYTKQFCMQNIIALCRQYYENHVNEYKKTNIYKHDQDKHSGCNFCDKKCMLPNIFDGNIYILKNMIIGNEIPSIYKKSVKEIIEESIKSYFRSRVYYISGNIESRKLEILFYKIYLTICDLLAKSRSYEQLAQTEISTMVSMEITQQTQVTTTTNVNIEINELLKKEYDFEENYDARNILARKPIVIKYDEVFAKFNIYSNHIVPQGVMPFSNILRRRIGNVLRTIPNVAYVIYYDLTDYIINLVTDSELSVLMSDGFKRTNATLNYIIYSFSGNVIDYNINGIIFEHIKSKLLFINLLVRCYLSNFKYENLKIDDINIYGVDLKLWHIIYMINKCELSTREDLNTIIDTVLTSMGYNNFRALNVYNIQNILDQLLAYKEHNIIGDKITIIKKLINIDTPKIMDIFVNFLRTLINPQHVITDISIKQIVEKILYVGVPSPQLAGGNPYHNKYIKYKIKYSKLKRNMNLNQIIEYPQFYRVCDSTYYDKYMKYKTKYIELKKVISKLSYYKKQI